MKILVRELRRKGDKVILLTPEGELDVDAGIARYVEVLMTNGVETFESCEGGTGHPFYEPTVRFFGGQAEGFRALGIAMQNGLPVSFLRRYWTILDGEPVGPQWEMTFVREKHREKGRR